MVPTLTEEKKGLTQYESKFRQLVNNLPRNRFITFIDNRDKEKAVLINEKTFEEIESYLETADILLSNPGVVKKLSVALKNSKQTSLANLRKELGL